MTYKENIIAEIRRLDAKLRDRNGAAISSRAVYRYTKEIISFIDSLPKEPVSEDLEEEITKLWNKLTSSETPMYDTPEPNALLCISKSNFQYIARHFANWQKQQMMKEAVEGVYDCDDDNSWIEFKGWAESTSEAGCKVKVIIIKEEKQ